MHNVINRIWLGGDMPEKFQQFGREWLDLNPGYTLHDWTEEEIFSCEDWVNLDVLKDMYTKSKKPGADMIAFYTHVADVVCYEIIYKYGGWYVNTDLKPIRPLASLKYYDWASALAMEDDENAVNMAMYCPANDPLFETIIRLLPHRYFSMPNMGMHITTGCGLISEALSQYTGQVTRFHRDVFNPIHWSTIPVGTEPDVDGREFKSETVAVHLWNHKFSGRGEKTLENE